MSNPLASWIAALICLLVALLNVAAHWFPWKVFPWAVDGAGRLRQVQRRAPQLRELILGGQTALTSLADALDDAHALLGAVLDQKHLERSQRHFSAVSGGDHDTGPGWPL